MREWEFEPGQSGHKRVTPSTAVSFPGVLYVERGMTEATRSVNVYDNARDTGRVQSLL